MTPNDLVRLLRVRMPFGLLLGLSLIAALAPASAKELYTEKSLYRNIIVYEDGGQRCMKFGRGFTGRQTCMDIAAPDRLVFDYTRMMLGALYLNPKPSRVLLIGLGGGTLASTLQKLYPDIAIDAVEIDPAVTKVAHRFFGFRPGPKTRVFEEDGRVFVKRALRNGVSYDLILLDAFDHDYIPEHLLTREFLQEVRKLLLRQGVLAANTFSNSRLYHYETATYQSVFGPIYRLKTGSRVILVREGGLPGMDELQLQAMALEDRLRPFGTGKDFLLPLIATESPPPAGTRVLTDQYSPSNLLNVN